MNRCAKRIEPSRFDTYVAAVTTGQSVRSTLTDDEVAGLRLFIGKANGTQCHSGPVLTNNEFHNTGVPARPELAIAHGRVEAAVVRYAQTGRLSAVNTPAFLSCEGRNDGQ